MLKVKLKFKRAISLKSWSNRRRPNNNMWSAIWNTGKRKCETLSESFSHRCLSLSRQYSVSLLAFTVNAYYLFSKHVLKLRMRTISTSQLSVLLIIRNQKLTVILAGKEDRAIHSPCLPTVSHNDKLWNSNLIPYCPNWAPLVDSCSKWDASNHKWKFSQGCACSISMTFFPGR